MEILRLLPDQIMENWHFIKQSMIEAFPPVARATDEAMLEIQQQFLVGEMDCWFATDSLESQGIIAVMTTKVVYEEVSRTRNMLIFSVTTYMPHARDLWTSGYAALRRYAASKGCRKIISFTNDDRVLRIAELLGADTSWHLVQLDI